MYYRDVTYPEIPGEIGKNSDFSAFLEIYEKHKFPKLILCHIKKNKNI